MEILLNGEPLTVAAQTTVAALLAQLDLVGKPLAVEINLEIVPRSAHASHLLQAGDRVEIVRAIGGG